MIPLTLVKTLLTPRNLAIAGGVAAIIFVVYTYIDRGNQINSLTQELGQVKQSLVFTQDELEKSNNKLEICHNEQIEISKKYESLVIEYESLNIDYQTSLSEICLRDDNVSSLKTETPKETVSCIDQPKADQKEIDRIEKSLNQRLNNRNF